MPASSTYLPRGVLLQVYGNDLLTSGQSVAVTAANGNGTTVTYTASNTFSAGQKVTITGITPSIYNLKDVTIASATSTNFTVTNSASDGASTTAGVARILSWNKVTEHNRLPIEVSTNRIEQSTRMANGSLRKFFVADKKQFSTSWSMLPGRRLYTADGYWGAEDLIKFYESTEGQETFKIKLNYSYDGTESFTEYNVNCTAFSSNLRRRGITPFWDIQMSMEEV